MKLISRASDVMICETAEAEWCWSCLQPPKFISFPWPWTWFCIFLTADTSIHGKSGIDGVTYRTWLTLRHTGRLIVIW